jgi:hypothetical protein
MGPREGKSKNIQGIAATWMKSEQLGGDKLGGIDLRFPVTQLLIKAGSLDYNHGKSCWKRLRS